MLSIGLSTGSAIGTAVQAVQMSDLRNDLNAAKTRISTLETLVATQSSYSSSLCSSVSREFTEFHI